MPRGWTIALAAGALLGAAPAKCAAETAALTALGRSGVIAGNVAVFSMRGMPRSAPNAKPAAGGGAARGPGRLTATIAGRDSAALKKAFADNEAIKSVELRIFRGAGVGGRLAGVLTLRGAVLTSLRTVTTGGSAASRQAQQVAERLEVTIRYQEAEYETLPGGEIFRGSWRASN
jgi:hypothetical protein